MRQKHCADTCAGRWLTEAKLRTGVFVALSIKPTHRLEDGAIEEWAPFPLVPSYGRLIGKLSKQKELKIYPVRELDGYVQVDLV